MVTYAVIMLMKVGVGPATPILSTTMRCAALVEVALTMMVQARKLMKMTLKCALVEAIFSPACKTQSKTLKRMQM